MNDSQIIAIAIIFIAALASMLYNNSRISDLRTDVGNRITDLGKRFDDVNRHIDDKFQILMERLQRMEDNLTHQLANHENRIQRLEEKK